MSEAYFFGYGSLVNRATHGYAPTHPARLTGWRRRWVQTASRDTPFLTAVRDAGSAIDGLAAPVPGGDWAALDLREEGYERHHVAISGVIGGAQVYAVPPASMVRRETPAPILLSYLDVVVQGYLRVFGPEGVTGFFDSTDGWDTPVLDDRARPRYPRHQPLTADERALVDARLGAVGARVLRG